MSTAVESCEKLGLFYPPTQRNLEAYDRVFNEQRNLIKICRDLEGGWMASVAGDESVIMPSGCLHAFITVSKGCLITASFLNTRSIQGMSAWIAYCPSAVEQEDKEHMIEMWILAAKLALYSHRSKTGLEGWSKVRSRMLHWVERRPIQNRQLRELWSEYF